MEKKSIVITNYDLVNILAWFDKDDGWFRTTKLPIPLRRMFKNIQTKLIELKEPLDSDIREIDASYADDEHSELTNAESGERQVKQEYIDEFRKQKFELLSMKIDFEFIPIPASFFEKVDCIDADYRLIELFTAE